jgi:hypothetical protein
MVQQYGYTLQYIEEPSEELCRLAVQQTDYALRYVKEPFYSQLKRELNII